MLHPENPYPTQQLPCSVTKLFCLHLGTIDNNIFKYDKYLVIMNCIVMLLSSTKRETNGLNLVLLLSNEGGKI